MGPHCRSTFWLLMKKIYLDFKLLFFLFIPRDKIFCVHYYMPIKIKLFFISLDILSNIDVLCFFIKHVKYLVINYSCFSSCYGIAVDEKNIVGFQIVVFSFHSRGLIHKYWIVSKVLISSFNQSVPQCSVLTFSHLTDN